MNFLKSLFAGGNNNTDKRGYYIYIKMAHCDEIVEVRIDLYNELSQRDDDDGYWIRKVAQATRCPFPAEATLWFDKKRNLVTSEVVKGELVEKDVYDAWKAAKEGTA